MKRIPLLAAISVMFAGAAAAQSQGEGQDDRGLALDGAYVGVSVSIQNMIGGALVDGVDLLAQDSRPVVTLFAGWRKEFGNGLVLGLEGGVGFEDGDLQLRNPDGLNIDYRNNFQFRYGGQIGWRTSDRALVFAYLSETKREFDVSGSGPRGSFTQTDGQGLLRYGVGIDYDLPGPLDFRGAIGSSRADFGDRALNRNPDKPIDVELGVVSDF